VGSLEAAFPELGAGGIHYRTATWKTAV